MLYCWQAVGDCVRNLLIRVMPLHEANTIMELAALNVAAMLFRCQLLQQRIKGLKIIVDAVNAVRVSWRHGVHCPPSKPMLGHVCVWCGFSGHTSCSWP